MSTTIARPGLAVALCFVAAVTTARADQRYVVSGNDTYQVGRSDLHTSIVYNGTQQLTVSKDGSQTRFRADVRYTRADGTGKVPAHATFVQEATGSGELRDKTDLDPDYLTVLNQPFAVELDAQTFADLARLRGRVPFVFPSPMTGGTLRGYLQRGSNARVSNHPVLGVQFSASGPMSGPLPDRNNVSIRGTMRMNGTAYYSQHGAPLLMALEETLAIEGTLHGRDGDTPVTIVYRRSIAADDSAPSLTEARR